MISLLLIGLLVGSIAIMQQLAPERGAPLRWYSEQQVEQGEALFQIHCAGCHGPDAASTPDWRVIDEYGNYPPPPLNGTAHAWHHPLQQLRQTVQDGGIPLGGVMPPFRTVLTDQEIDAVLAWVQDHWSDEIYLRWLERNGPL